MPDGIGDGNAAIAEVRAEVRGLRREADSQGARLAKIEEAVGRMYYMPDQIKDLKELIERLDERQTARGEVNTQNMRSGYVTAITLGVSVVIFLAGVLANIAIQALR